MDCPVTVYVMNLPQSRNPSLDRKMVLPWVHQAEGLQEGRQVDPAELPG